ncbi:MAG: hypothetical protein AB1757_20145 [Acidobacteriota bacterium]
MIKHLLGIYLLLVSVVCIILPSTQGAHFISGQRKPSPNLRCTQAALDSIIEMPELEYECIGNEEDDLKSLERRKAMQEYLQAIESNFADKAWWATSVEQLNACAIAKEARALTKSEGDDFEMNIHLYGDGQTRLVSVVDPCIHYSYSTLNTYILERVGEQVFATQILNAYYTRIDAALALDVAEHQGERLLFVTTNTSDGMMPPDLFTTFKVYTINSRTHRAVPKKIFKENSKLTNEFRFDQYLFTGRDAHLANRWQPPKIILNRSLAPRFYVYTPRKHRLVRETYIWKGRYYEFAG